MKYAATRLRVRNSVTLECSRPPVKSLQESTSKVPTKSQHPSSSGDSRRRRVIGRACADVLLRGCVMC